MSDTPSFSATARSLGAWFLLSTPTVALLFLWWSAFFTSWNGMAVSARPASAPDPVAYQVLIVDSNGKGVEMWWPAELVDQLKLKANALAIPPMDPSGPWTSKTRFGWSYTVEKPAEAPAPEEGDAAEPPPPEVLTRSTLGFGPLGAALLAWILSLALRNMWASGSPFGLAARERYIVEGTTRRQQINLRQYPSEPVPPDEDGNKPQGGGGTRNAPRGPQPPPRSRNLGRR